MTVAPAHQYRGAGGLMCKWATDLADEIGAQVGKFDRQATKDAANTG